MSTCMPSPGPMWATWLKLVGLDIILDLSSGSLSISLGKEGVWGLWTRNAVRAQTPGHPQQGCGAGAYRRCCSRSSSGTLKTNRLLLLVRSICFLLLSEVSGTVSAAPAGAGEGALGHVGVTRGPPPGCAGQEVVPGRPSRPRTSRERSPENLLLK